jgi:tRNA pseudouridine(38-40) synthase
MERFNHRVELAYAGDRFHGFVRQLGLRTVEGVTVEALQRLAPELGGLAVGGRTDRGVHATGQVISFWTRRPLDPEAVRAVLDAAAPDALATLSVCWAPRTFHATFSAKSRRYVYLWPADDAWLTRLPLLRRQLAALVGRRCFSAFARDTPAGAPTEKAMLHTDVRAVTIDGALHLRFDVEAEAFLRRMVRVLVATALREADRGSDDDVLVRLAAARDRGATAPPADPTGLHLVHVRYDAVEGRSRRGRVERSPLERRVPLTRLERARPVDMADDGELDVGVAQRAPEADAAEAPEDAAPDGSAPTRT